MTILYSDSLDDLKYEVKDIPNKVYLDYQGNLLELLNKLSQESFFSLNNENYLITNPSFLFDKKLNKEIIDKIFNTNKSIYFLVHSDKLDGLNKEIEQNKNIKKVHISKKISLKDFEQILSKYNINFPSEETKKKFYEQAYQNKFFILNEIEKLMIYSSNNQLTEEAVNKLKITLFEENIFNLFTFFFKGNKTKFLKGYESLIQQKVSPITIINAFGAQLITAIVYKTCLLKQMNSTQIFKEAKIPIFQQIKMDFIKNIKKDKLINLINNLCLLDYNTKIKKVDQYTQVKIFFLKNI